MSSEPAAVLGRTALELDWRELPCLFRALWRFGTIDRFDTCRPKKRLCDNDIKTKA